MTLEVLHRSRGKPARLTALDAEYDAALGTKAEPSEIRPYQRQSPQPGAHACERSPNGQRPFIPKPDEAGKENPPESFDTLAVRLNKRFDKLAADIEQMRKELGEAAEQSKQLRQKLLRNGALRA